MSVLLVLAGLFFLFVLLGGGVRHAYDTWHHGSSITFELPEEAGQRRYVADVDEAGRRVRGVDTGG